MESTTSLVTTTASSGCGSVGDLPDDSYLAASPCGNDIVIDNTANDRNLQVVYARLPEAEFVHFRYVLGYTATSQSGLNSCQRFAFVDDITKNVIPIGESRLCWFQLKHNTVHMFSYVDGEEYMSLVEN